MAKSYLDAEGTARLVEKLQLIVKNKVSKSEVADMIAEIKYPEPEEIKIGEGLVKAEDGTISVDPSLTVEEVAFSKVAGTPTTLAGYGITDAASAASVEEIAAALEKIEAATSGVYHYKGTVANLASLENIEAEEGDVYNLEDTGMNVAWTGEAWDELGTTVDLSEYIKADEIEAITKAEIDAIWMQHFPMAVESADELVSAFATTGDRINVTIAQDMKINQNLVVPAGKEATISVTEGTTVDMGSATIATYGEGSSITIDGGGTIKSTKTAVMAQAGGTVTIEDATIVSTGGNGVSASGDGAELIIEGGDITAQEYGVNVIKGGSVVVNGGNITGVDNFAIGGNGSAGWDACDVTINGGHFEGHIESAGYIATVIYWPGAGTLTINGGEFISDGAGIVQRGGHVVLNGGEIYANGTSGVLGKAGDSKVTVGPYAVVFDKKAAYPYSEDMSLEIGKDMILMGTDGDVTALMPDGETANIIDHREIIG